MLSRRSFLASAAAATAAPLVWPRTAGAAPSDKLTLGFIGVGTMGRGHLGGFLGRGTVEVVAVCDVVDDRLNAAADMVEKKYAERKKSGQFAGVKKFTDFRELLAMPGLDAVVISTPDHWHAIPCIAAARAKKHIYCEKPLTHHVAEGRAIADAVTTAKVVFQTGSQQRTEFGGHFRKAVEYVWNGRIGKLKTVRIGVGGPAVSCTLPTQDVPKGTHWDLWQGPAPDRGYHEDLCPKGVHKHFPAWRNYREYAGGGLADMGAHHFDIAQWAMKMDASGPVEVIPPTDPKATSGLKFVYASGVEMIHNQFVKDKDGKELRADCVFEGTDGIILVSRDGIRSLPDTILNEKLDDKAERVYPSTDHKGNWLDSIVSGKPTICPAEVGHRSATICHLGNIG
ncbi:MAG: Gfo/Idh/MocA family oxidoreductase, partial [Fimbriiglobus sp.]|nr:Gfo/Idh/MocA family oxidoreductase [Fimbriiglobus sp.]